MLKRFIRLLKTSPLMVPLLVLIDLVLFLIDTVAIGVTPITKRSKSLLVIKLDMMGDYLMLRNYLRLMKKTARYRDHKLALLGNIAVKSLAEAFDADVVDQFIWVDIYKLSTHPLYRFRLVRQLRLKGYTVVLCPTYSRVLVLDDYLVRATGAVERVGCETDFINSKLWEVFFGNNLYTRLIPLEKGIIFEMDRNRQITEGFLQEPVQSQKPILNERYAKSVDVPTAYIVFSLGAGQDFRIWPAKNYVGTAEYIIAHYPAYKIILTGAPGEQTYADQFLAGISDTSSVIDLTGHLSIPELVYVLTKAKLLIANETGIAHIAAATGTQTLIISQGKSLVRWHPYPARVQTEITYLYPDFVEKNRHRLSEIAPLFNPESPYSISEISVERVIDQITEKLG
jgi:ADP-heptose:LPS heptosyltransferase